MAGLYLHIPFCQRRCGYCDFYSTTSLELREALVEALCVEMEERCALLPTSPSTLYLGGGTPSLLSPSQVKRLIDQAKRVWRGAVLKEVTLEANPDDLSEAYLAEVRESGVNRLSIGIQSFFDETLRAMNRRHTASEGIEAIKRARAAGFDNLSIDLIYGLPNLTPEGWEETLATALSLEPEHISAYHLTFEEGTPWGEELRRGAMEELPHEVGAAHFELLRHLLTEAGYRHYELSNFALPEREARHNSSYWEGVPYLGLGPSAHSYDGESRFANAPDLASYLMAPAHVWSEERLSETDRLNEEIMIRLRTARGIDLHRFEERFGAQKLQQLLSRSSRYLHEGLLHASEGRLWLDERGYFVSDSIIADLFTSS